MKQWLFIGLCLFAATALATPTVGTVACNPADNGALANSSATVSVTPNSMVAGDLVWMIAAARSGAVTFTISSSGGQTWNSNTQSGASIPLRRTFWAIYNGTWSSNPSVAVSATEGSAVSLCIVGIRPTAGKVWAADVAQVESGVTTASPQTITGQAATASGVTIASFVSDSDARTWSNLTAGWSTFGDGNLINTTGTGLSLALVYKLNAAAGATGNVSYTPNTSSVARMSIQTWKEEVGTPPAAAIKFHPGHYLWSTKKSFNSDGSNLAAMLSDAAVVCANSNVVGMQLTIYMGFLEGAMAGDYGDGSGAGGAHPWGFDAIDEILDALKCGESPDKQLMLNVSDSVYAGTDDDSRTIYFPDYLLSSSTYDCGNGQNGVVNTPNPPPVATPWPTWTGGLGAVVCMWKPAVMDRLIALRKAYGERYDSEPQFEMISAGGETAIGAEDVGFSYSAYITQLKRQMEATSAAWPTTTIRLPANYTGGVSNGDSEMNELLDLCATLPNCAAGGPDPELPLPIAPSSSSGRTIQANELFRGLLRTTCPTQVPPLTSPCGFVEWTTGGTDRRADIPWVGEQQDLGLNVAGKPIEDPSEIQDYQKNTMHMRWMIWIKGGRWNSGLAPYVSTQINSDDSVYSTACPYASCAP